jgi:hypothetical protein
MLCLILMSTRHARSPYSQRLSSPWIRLLGNSVCPRRGSVITQLAGIRGSPWSDSATVGPSCDSGRKTLRGS